MECKVCGKPLQKRHRRFCSEQCHAATRDDYTPSRSRILAKCRAFRLAWDKETEAARRVVRPVPFVFPVVSEELFRIGGEP